MDANTFSLPYLWNLSKIMMRLILVPNIQNIKGKKNKERKKKKTIIELINVIIEKHQKLMWFRVDICEAIQKLEQVKDEIQKISNNLHHEGLQQRTYGSILSQSILNMRKKMSHFLMMVSHDLVPIYTLLQEYCSLNVQQESCIPTSISMYFCCKSCSTKCFLLWLWSVTVCSLYDIKSIIMQFNKVYYNIFIKFNLLLNS